MEQEAGDGFSNMSKSAILRGIIAEKLTTAAQEILAVVERTVAGYEEEAAGFRQELDRQRRQLEVLLQPEIKLETTDDQQLFPICELLPEEASGGGGELPEEEQQHKIELSVEYDGSVGLLCYTGEQTREEEEESSERSALTPTQGQDHLPEPGYDVASRLSPPTVQSDRWSAGRPLVSEPRSHMDLRVCILEDSQIEVLSAKVFQKYPVQELQCPRGLQEADFLDLLRSSFPQLAAEKPFDVFSSDRSRTLKPLGVKTLIPEEIDRTIRSIGAGNSALYIRLKAQEEPEATEELHPSQRKDAAADSSSSLVPTRQHTGMQPYRRRRRRRRGSESHSHVDLRIRILEDIQADVLSINVFQKYPEQQLQCPRELQEADFLDLLWSTFPQLAADKPFDLFTSDRSRKLHLLKVKTLTPEEIYRSIRSSGAGRSALYIRLKPPEQLQSTTRDQTSPNTSVQSDRRRPSRPRLSEPQNHIKLRVRLLEDSQINMLSARVFRKYPKQELQCPCGLQEADFLDLLRSTFPQLATDKPFDVFTADKSRTLRPLVVKTLTPEEISRSTKSVRHSVLYIRLKAPEEAQSGGEKLQLLQRKTPTRQNRSSVQQEGSRVDFLFSCSTKKQQNMDAEEADDEDCERSASPSLWSLQSLLLSESERDEEEVNDGDDDWKPEKTDESLRVKEPEKTAGRRRAERSGVQRKRKQICLPRQVLTGGDSDAHLSCKVCAALRGSTGMLIKHSWSHVDDPERLCGVCGERSESAEQLRSHLQSHQKTHSCNICGKSFLSTSGLNGHIARHKGEKPYKCKICPKAFTEKSTLNNHMWVHTVDKPYRCDICQMSSVSKVKMRIHRLKHTGEKPYSCSMCTKPFCSLGTLSQHMLTHSGHTGAREKPYVCQVCSKRFYSNQRLQTHLRSHSSQRPNGCSKCKKHFTCKAKLVTHMRVHTL
ncbi:uncharacterized protein [Trachinotus anak]|uniref:uncharacterized protein isoform X2 n=1 Tax=Trachinotus anak TaxID=443729 RepID=UPI0039F19593